MATDSPACKHILIVEDNEVERVGLTVILQRAGYTVTAAEDGARALALMRGACRPDVVLLDMVLPGQDGWDFLTERRREPRLSAVPVILVTRLGEAAPGWAKALGARACLRKPVDVPALLAEVRRCAV